MTAQEVLLEAAEYLELYGWIQGEMGAFGGPCCIVGATVSVDPLGEARAEAQLAVRRYLSVDSLPLWNDAPGRTAAEVIAALRGAAGGAK